MVLFSSFDFWIFFELLGLSMCVFDLLDGRICVFDRLVDYPLGSFRKFDDFVFFVGCLGFL